jgi:hypothetical protein
VCLCLYDRMSSKRTGKFCVAAGCTSTHRDNVSLHEFPKDDRADIRRQWVNFIKTKRRDFSCPTPNSVVCEKHFSPNCYPLEYSLKKSVGMSIKRKLLLRNAVPTIHFAGDSKSVLLGKRNSSTLPNAGENAATTSRPSQPKKMRSAFVKRECIRVSLNIYAYDMTIYY